MRPCRSLTPEGVQVHESVQQPHSGTDHEPSKDSILAEADQLLSQGQLTGAAVMLQRAVRGMLCSINSGAVASRAEMSGCESSAHALSQPQNSLAQAASEEWAAVALDQIA